MATRITVVLKGDAQIGHFEGETTPEYYNERYAEAVNGGHAVLSFEDVDGDFFSFRTDEIKAISFVAV